MIMSLIDTFLTMLKLIVKWLFSVLLLWSVWVGFAQAEQITSFFSEIIVQEDSSLIIIETIDYDFESEYRHGIYRNISSKHAQSASVWYKQRYIDLSLISVTRDGLSESFTLESYDGMSVKIGNANKTITGKHQYEIEYRVKGALSVFSDGPELYWNVTGDEWIVPIMKIQARITPTRSVKTTSDSYCYAGNSGIKEECQYISVLNGSPLFSQGILHAGEQLTVAQGLILSKSPVVLERYNSLLLWLVSIALGLIVLIVTIYRWRTKYKISLPVIAQYEPYQDFKPMFTGVLFDNKLDSKDISAGIVYLAQQGFITINQIKSEIFFLVNFEYVDYEVTLKRSFSEVQSNFDEQMLRLLFGVSGVKMDVIKLSKIKKDKKRLRVNFNIVQGLKIAVVNDLIKLNFIDQKLSRFIKGIIFIPIFVINLILITVISNNLFLIIALFIVSFSGLFVMFASERRTVKGYEALNHIQGFKLFLSVTEKERYKFHSVQSLSPQEFMKYLPYAIALGVEKQWAEVFKDIQIDSPDWYISTTNVAFSAASFTTNLTSFSNYFATSSGSSGSSGRGSSGGGSGGGGGGSW